MKKNFFIGTILLTALAGNSFAQAQEIICSDFPNRLHKTFTLEKDYSEFTFDDGTWRVTISQEKTNSGDPLISIKASQSDQIIEVNGSDRVQLRRYGSTDIYSLLDLVCLKK